MICSSSVIESMSGRSSLAGRISADRMPKRDLGPTDIGFLPVQAPAQHPPQRVVIAAHEAEFQRNIVMAIRAMEATIDLQ